MGRPWQGSDHEHETRLAKLHRQVFEELPQAVLAGCLRLDQTGREGIRLRPAMAGLDQTELGDVAADRGLRCPKASLSKRARQFLLGSDRALLDQVANRALAELLHDFHRSGRSARPPGAYRASRSTTTRAARTTR